MNSDQAGEFVHMTPGGEIKRSWRDQADGFADADATDDHDQPNDASRLPAPAHEFSPR